MTSYRRSIATIGLSPDVSEIKGDIGRKSQIFPTHVYSAPHWRGSPWNWISAPGIKKTRVMGLPGGERSLTIFSAVWIEYTNYVTDGRTDTGRQQRPLLHIASCGKTVKRMSYSDWGLFSRSLHAVINMPVDTKLSPALKAETSILVRLLKLGRFT